jgi:hypothetical protein
VSNNAAVSTNLPWGQANQRWAVQINQLLKNPLNSASILENINLVVGTNVINHLLGKIQQGWFLTDIQGELTYMPYRNTPFNASTLSLYSPSSCTVSIGVF